MPGRFIIPREDPFPLRVPPGGFGVIISVVTVVGCVTLRYVTLDGFSNKKRGETVLDDKIEGAKRGTKGLF